VAACWYVGRQPRVVMLCADMSPCTCLQEPCSLGSVNASTCQHGFAIQGNFEPARRNYTRLWRQVEDAVAAGSVPTQPPVRLVHLHLVGRGNISTLGIPDAVVNHTTVHFNLKFPEYYSQVRLARHTAVHGTSTTCWVSTPTVPR
jgi:hypothetical protein